MTSLVLVPEKKESVVRIVLSHLFISALTTLLVAGVMYLMGYWTAFLNSISYNGTSLFVNHEILDAYNSGAIGRLYSDYPVLLFFWGILFLYYLLEAFCDD